MTEYGVTDAGFIVKPLDVLIAEAAESSITLFGTNVDTSDSSPLGKINQTACAELAIYWEKMNTAYLASFLDSASGDNLDKIVYPLGVNRKEAAYATGRVSFDGTDRTTVPGQTLIKTTGDPSIEFETDGAILIGDIVVNGDFTNNPAGWFAYNNASLAAILGGADGRCLQITCGTNDTPYARHLMVVNENNIYDFSVLVKAGTAATYNVDIYDESNSEYIYQSGDLTETAGDWSEEVSTQIEAPAGCTRISIRLIHRAIGGAGTTMLFDTCKFVHVSTTVTAAVPGSAGNVASETITALSSPISGITSVINHDATSGGTAKETDVALRIRTKQSIGAGGKATLNAIVAEVLEVDNVSSVTIEENETDTDYTDMLTNSGFTTDTSSWTSGNSAVLASIAGGEDGNCLRITGNGVADDPYAYQAATVVPGDNYIFTVYVLAGTEATYAVKLYDVSNAGYIYESAELEETAGGWSTSITKSFVAPTGCVSVRAELYQISTAATTVLYFDTAILDGLPPHSVRVSVSGGDDDDVAQALLDSVAAGIKTCGEESGDGTIDNGQAFERRFARPIEILIYVSATITSDDTYAGDAAVESAIISYIGGVDADTITYIGIGAGEDVIFYEVVSAIMDVIGVTNAVVYIDMTSSPVATSDVSISSTEVSYASTASVVIS